MLHCTMHGPRSSLADGCPPCINGDIAIQWEWSNFDPSQNQNPLTDYDKTLHNWLGPRDEHVTQNLCQSTLFWENTWNIRPYLFILIYFFPDSPTEVILGRIFTHNVSNYAQSHKEVPFWGLHDGRKHLGGQIPPYSAERLNCPSITIDVIEEWRHWRVTA